MKRIFRLFGVFLSIYGAWHLGHQGYQRMASVLVAAPRKAVVVGNAGVKHVAFIMDGNRRWAKARQMMPWDGHQRGVGPVKEAVKFCLDHQIKILSLYAFSLENFKRSRDELQHLFDVIENGLSGDDLAELARKGVRIRFIGDRAHFPSRLVSTISSIESTTNSGDCLLVNILFCYGGQQELCSAAQAIAKQVLTGKLRIADINERCFADSLWLGDCPPPDMVVRSGGERRLSNCMPWQTTYSELFFIDTFWPAMTRDDFESLLFEYHTRKRNFGA